MTVTDEMIEAAAKALFDRREDEKTNANLRWAWSDFAEGSDTKEFWRKEARAALEAALSVPAQGAVKVKPLEWNDTVHEFGDAGCRNSRADGLLFGQSYAIYTTPADGVTISAQYGGRQLTDSYASVEAAKAAAQADYEQRILSALDPAHSGEREAWPADAKFKLGERVRKHSGSWWEGVVVGFYSTKQTPIGYNVQLEGWTNGPVQIYPEAALETKP